ncbi:uncharacterized protein YALI1_E15774g [Yarrowia lipolytica]|uniref:Nitrogen permease regulator 3 n=1 Tax=Yarrowia lipolytica TaxID=4952 RepID=A0A1D8NI83_YARLL|nr:hypothetical protein YALI1_E15774g [Yarrowia lipolytica]
MTRLAYAIGLGGTLIAPSAGQSALSHTLNDMTNIPNPCLLAILVTCATSTGPQFVFHYPPKPKSYGYRAAAPVIFRENEESSGDSESSEDDLGDILSDSDESDKEEEEAPALDYRRLNKRDQGKKESRRRRKEILKNLISNYTTAAEFDYNFGDDTPDDDGTTTASQGTSRKNSLSENSWDKVLGFDAQFLGDILTPEKSMCQQRFELTLDDMVFTGLPVHVNDDGRWRRKKEYDREEKEVGEEDEEPKSNLVSFHVSFVVNPPLAEYNQRVDEMYFYIASQLAVALRAEQAKSDWVGQQLRQIAHLREAAAYEKRGMADLWRETITTCPLAHGIAQLFHSIQNASIASIVLNKSVRSFQIPVETEMASLPLVTEPHISGAYLTTESFSDSDSKQLHFALLLLDEPESIISDLEAQKDYTLCNFISHLKPWIPLKQVVQDLQISAEQALGFSKHLIYWRRGRAILPINKGNSYIVSPIAPIESLYEFAPRFAVKFPGLPSLPRMLSSLSTGKPQQFAKLIPSRDHKTMYYRALAWLLQYGFVTQLRTFLYLKISKKIKLQVKNQTRDKRDNDFNLTNPLAISRKSSESLKDRHFSASISSHVSKDSPEASEIHFAEDDSIDDSILLEPDRATLTQRKWLNKILENQPQDVVLLFNRLKPYFNGKHAIEQVVIEEGLSRNELRRLTQSLEEHLLMVRHW